MKKLLSALCIVGSLAFASNAFAVANGAENDDANGIEGVAFTASTNVEIDYSCTNGSTSAGQDYYLMTKHSAGDRVFAATNNSNPVFQSDDAYKGQTIAETGVTAPDEGADTANITGDDTWEPL